MKYLYMSDGEWNTYVSLGRKLKHAESQKEVKSIAGALKAVWLVLLSVLKK